MARSEWHLLRTGLLFVFIFSGLVLGLSRFAVLILEPLASLSNAVGWPNTLLIVVFAILAATSAATFYSRSVRIR